MSLIDMIVALRGGIPECCDFCGQKFTEQNYATPEEAGEWACIQCVARWEKQKSPCPYCRTLLNSDEFGTHWCKEGQEKLGLHSQHPRRQQRGWEMKIAVLVDDAGMACNVGGNVKTTVYLFDMPKEVQDFIESHTDKYTECSIAVAPEKKP